MVLIVLNKLNIYEFWDENFHVFWTGENKMNNRKKWNILYCFNKNLNLFYNKLSSG